MYHKGGIARTFTHAGTQKYPHLQLHAHYLAVFVSILKA